MKCLTTERAIKLFAAVTTVLIFATGGAALPPAKPIQDLKSVAGKWEGWAGNPGGRGPYEITLKEDGTYEASVPGLGKVNGIVRMSGGEIRLKEHTTGVTGTIALHEGEGERILKFVADDRSVWFEVKPAGTGLTARATVMPVETLADGQTGRIGFRSVTLTTRQFLTGVKDGKSVVIWGDLRLPRGAGGRLPAMILVHSSGGAGSREDQWAKELNGIGVATFVLDSFTGRGIIGTGTDQSRLNSQTMIVDAYRALELLSTHPRIDPTRIAIMGFSKGGIVSLYASLTRFRRMHGPAGVEFAAYLPFYAFCNYTYIDEEHVSDRPIRIFHGAADESTPVASCREYAHRLRQAGKDVEITVYADAHHEFDNPWAPGRFLPYLQNPSACFLVERPGGEIVNRDTGRPFSFNDPCLTLGYTVTYDPRAHRQAVQAVKAFLKATFKLSL